MSKETAKTLKQALTILEKDGWCKGFFHHHGRHCLAGAIDLAEPDGTKARIAREALTKFTEGYSVVGFNDKQGQSKKNIIALLKKGIRSQQQLP